MAPEEVVVLLVLLLPSLALAQDYRMPTSLADYDELYPTAYYDHSGVDWNCGWIR
mgnify:CR=1 FL=1